MNNLQNLDNTNWKEEVKQNLYFIQVTSGNEIVKVYRWHSERNRYDVISEVLKHFKGEIPHQATLVAYEVQ